MNLTKDERSALNELRIDPESWYDSDAYTSEQLIDADTETMDVLVMQKLAEYNGHGYRLTPKGIKALRYGKYTPVKPLLPPKNFRTVTPRCCGTCRFGFFNGGSICCRRLPVGENGISDAENHYQYVCDRYEAA